MIICFVFLLILLGIFLKWHDKIAVEQIALVFFFSVFFSFSLNLFIMARDTFGNIIGLYLVLVTFVGAFMSDTGAYFCGIRFGRHKLAPFISPKKTVEGAVGGIIVGLLSQLAAAFVFTQIMKYFGFRLQINVLRLIILSPLLSVMGILGDLLASQIKRQYKIKDFGNIMPGHGGVLDRFDSVLLIVPPVYLTFSLISIIEIL
jgi:phosphatidate cytidylyltransferase